MTIIIPLIIGWHCGNEDLAPIDPSVATSSLPVITRISPATGAIGTTATIFGYGFSTNPLVNMVSVGGTTTTAATYALVSPPIAGEIESLTFTIPTGAPLGVQPIFVIVFDNTTNTDITFTVTP